MNDNPNSAGPGDYLARLRDLTFRLLATQDRPAKEILVGLLPEQWPSDLPILEDSRIIGSQVPLSGELVVILGTDLPIQSVYDIYDATLLAAGWTPLEVEQPFGVNEGFAASLRLQHFHYFREDKENEEHGQGLTLRVKANGLPDGSTEIRLYLEHKEPSAPDQQQSRRHFGQPPILPLLNAPAGAELAVLGGGSGDLYRTSTAFIDTEMDIHSLATFYAGQLVRAGWQMNDQESSGPIAWTTWFFRGTQGDGWEGTLLVAQNRSSGDQGHTENTKGTEDKRNYYLSIHARML